MEALVYKATSPSGKSYIGITKKTLEERVKRHHIDAIRKKDNKFRKALLKYGDSISWKVLQKANSWEEAKYLERKYIKELNTYKKGYNSTLGGDGVLGNIPWNKGKTLENTEPFKNSKKTKLKKSVAKGAKPFIVYTKDGTVVGNFVNQRECARFLNIPKSYVWRCLNGIKKSARGYIFKFEESN